MIRALALGMLAAGIALTVYGVNASRSFGSEVSRVFTGNPTDNSMWMMGGGVALMVTAVVLFLGSTKGRGWYGSS